MTPAEIALIGLHALAMLLGVFAATFGLAFWIAGFANLRTSSVRQNAYAAALITASYYLLSYALSG